MATTKTTKAAKTPTKRATTTPNGNAPQKRGDAANPDKTAEELLKEAQKLTENKDDAPPAIAEEGTVEPKSNNGGGSTLLAGATHGTTEPSEGAAAGVEGRAQEISDWELATTQLDRKLATEQVKDDFRAQGKPIPPGVDGANPPLKDLLATSRAIDKAREQE